VSTIKRPPKHLKAAGSRLWRKVLESFALEDEHHLLMLQTACECADRLAECRDLIATQGVTVLDRYGVPKGHPALAAERDARVGLLRTLRELGLDAAAGEEYSRPQTLLSGGKRYGRGAS
jgi:P27 family predicted phage terminase small subunit